MNWRAKWYKVIFSSDTDAGKDFDIFLFVMILLSVVGIVVKSLPAVAGTVFEVYLYQAEWFFTVLFTIEYVVRILVNPKPLRYVFSFFGVVDLISFLPTYLIAVYPAIGVLKAIRVLRLLRIFHVMHLNKYIFEANILFRALRQSKQRIFVFVLAVLSVAMVAGAIMYAVEGPTYGFDSILHGMYWAIVTLTTVGYGDLAPVTALGRVVATFLMLLGYGLIAVPTGVFSVELAKMSLSHTHKKCSHCGATGHSASAKYCHECGGKV